MRSPLVTRSQSCSTPRGRGRSGSLDQLNVAASGIGVGKAEKGQKRAEANRKYQENYRIKGVEARLKLPELYARIAELERENSRLKDLLWKQRDPKSWEQAKSQEASQENGGGNGIFNLSAEDERSLFGSHYQQQHQQQEMMPQIVQPSPAGMQHSFSCQNLNWAAASASPTSPPHHNQQMFAQTHGHQQQQQLQPQQQEDIWNRSWANGMDNSGNGNASPFHHHHHQPSPRGEGIRSRTESVQSFDSTAGYDYEPQWSQLQQQHQGLSFECGAADGSGNMLGLHHSSSRLDRASSCSDICPNFPGLAINDSSSQGFEGQPPPQPMQPIDGFFAPPFASDIMVDPNAVTSAPAHYGPQQANNYSNPLTTINEDTPRLWTDLNTPSLGTHEAMEAMQALATDHLNHNTNSFA